MDASLIVVDWGSTNFRAYLVNDSAEIIAQRSAPCGMLTLKPAEFSAVLQEQVGPWLEACLDIPIVMSGMVGARGGWREAPYLEAPLRLRELAKKLVRVTFDKAHDTYIVPGISYQHDTEYDVMRGEETQLLGALREQNRTVYCLPGTHSKWAVMDGDLLTRFRTYMTGELYTLLTTSSILSRSCEHSIETESDFKAGVLDSVQKTNLLSDLFTIRAATVLGYRDEKTTRAYLSGLLIGMELTAASAYLGLRDSVEIGIIAAPDLAERYCNALGYLGYSGAAINSEQAVVSGAFVLHETRTL